MPPRYDLLNILDALRRRFRFIMLVAILAALGAGIATLLRPKEYTATTEFFVSSPFFSDRNNIYHTSNQTAAFIGYFASEEDIDKVIGISHTEEAKLDIIRKTQLVGTYRLDSSKKKDIAKAAALFYNNFDIKRSEYGLMQITFTHPDPLVAARVANASAKEIGRLYSDYHNGLRGDVEASLQEKVREADSAITVLTDSLGILRDHYQLYDILSPTRQTVVTGNMRNGGPGFGYAVEQVQNIESIKDQLVTDRARYNSILNEYRTPKTDKEGMIRIISPALPPSAPSTTGPVITAIAVFLIAGLFAALWVLIMNYMNFLVASRKTAV